MFRNPSAAARAIPPSPRDKIGPVAAFKMAICVKWLPKTRSGKILRGTMQKIADDMPWTMPPTIDDPLILEEITAILKERGYARSGAGTKETV